MELRDRLDPVLAVAREAAPGVDSEAAYPEASVAALRESGLLGLTLPDSAGGLGGDRTTSSLS